MEKIKFNRYVFLITAIWTIVIGLTLFSAINEEHRHVQENEKITAQIVYQKDLMYRRWTSIQGGLYVPISDYTPPNQYLKFIDNRDVVTTNGDSLTLVNPAYMTRQVLELSSSEYDLPGHLTSLNPINPDNVSDEWETQALLAFENGDTLWTKVDSINGKEYLRYIRPFVVEQNCLKCHEHQGYKLGDIRGALSIAVPTFKLKEVMNVNINTLILNHLAIWVVGLLGLLFFSSRLKKQIISRQKVELELKESETLLLNIFENSTNLFYSHTPKYELKYLSPQIKNILGYLPDEVKIKWNKLTSNHPINDIGHEKTQKAIDTGIAQASYELELLHKNGSKVWVEVREAPVVEDKKTIAIVGSLTDITERKITERNLIEAKQDLVIVNKKLLEEQNIFMIGDVVVFKWKYEENWPVEYVSKNVSNVFGYKCNDFINGEIEFGELIHKDDIERVGEEVDIAVNNNLNYLEHSDYRIINKSGKEVWLYDFTTILRNENGEITHFYGYVMDVTNRKKVEEELLEAKKQAEDANHLKSDFLANMSHEIRTPMNSIIGFSSILQKRIKDKKYHSYLDKIVKSGNNLLELIDDILDFSKIEARQLDIQKEAANPYDIFNEVASDFSVLSKQKQISVGVIIDEKLPESLLLDALRIKQVLLNLVSNAIKFTEKGSVSINVTFQKTLTKERDFKPSKELAQSLNLIIEVKDTGIGIAENQIETIFESFRQVEGQSTKKYGGTGLGLAITKNLVELMDGTISVESTFNVGSNFIVKLHNVEILDSVQDKKISSESVDIILSKSKILHVEDVDYNREIVSLFLENEDIELKEVESGKEALEVLKTYTPDLILMDIQLPGLNGYETATIIRRNEKLKKIPIIALTANATKEEIEKYSQFFDDYLTKPVDEDLLLRTVAKFIEYTKNTKSEAEFENCISKLQKEKIEIGTFSDEAINELKRDIEPLYIKLLEVLSVDDLNIFIEKNKKFGKKYDINALIEYSEVLFEAVDYFNLNKINDLLRYYSEIIAIIYEK